MAGREVQSCGFGPWTRPVSRRELGELIKPELICDDGGLVEVMDVVDVTFEHHWPHGHQHENHLNAMTVPWVRRTRLGYDELLAAVEPEAPTLWPNGHSSKGGENNRVPWEEAQLLDHSLRLIHVPAFTLHAAVDETPPQDKAFRPKWRWRVRVEFAYQDVPYLFWVTDPYVEKLAEKRGEGSHAFEEAIFCVSLGEPYDGYCYKLAATIITPKRAQARR